MKILFVFTGGTIGSTESDGIISPDREKSYKIIDFYAKNHKIDFEYDVTEPYVELSENNTGENIKALVECVTNNLGKGYDGIIVTHGTDTLQYSAAALGYALGLSSIPVCIVSANRPIEHEGSNALDNLHGAISFILSGAGRGAFVVYRNDGDKAVSVHRATRLVGVKSFSDEVSSINGEAYGRFDKGFKLIKNRRYKEQDDALSPLFAEGMSAVNESVLFITPYVGMSYPTLSDKVRYVIFNTYHSGTLDTKSAWANGFFAEARERGISIFAVGVSCGATYESAEAFAALGIAPLYNIAPIAAYMKLWLLECGKMKVDELLQKPLSGDVAF